MQATAHLAHFCVTTIAWLSGCNGNHPRPSMKSASVHWKCVVWWHLHRARTIQANSPIHFHKGVPFCLGKSNFLLCCAARRFFFNTRMQGEKKKPKETQRDG